jgi:spore coat polysaccharide biosynthesis protein SpsF
MIVATSTLTEDDPIDDLCGELKARCLRGHPTDVLKRYQQAAKAAAAEFIVRLTADCPLIDGSVVDQTVTAFLSSEPPVDYASNRIVRTYPVGMDVEVMTASALEQADREATEDYQREHVTPYLYEEPDRFRVLSIEAEADYGSHRWTVDTEEDLSFVRQIYRRFDGSDEFGWREVLELLEQEPELMQINSGVRQKPYWMAG